jgi:hypothetical protein
MTRALRVSLSGQMTQDTLARMREKLSLESRGRLTDAEDVLFGYRHLQHDDQNWINLDLIRSDDTHWILLISHMNEPPPSELLDQTLSQMMEAAAELGLTVAEVTR